MVAGGGASGLSACCLRQSAACTELGSYLDDVQEPGREIDWWEVLGGVGFVAGLVLACWVPYPF